LEERLYWQNVPPERQKLLEMAEWVQDRTIDPWFWPKQFAEWLLLAGLLPAAGFAGLQWITGRLSARRQGPT